MPNKIKSTYRTILRYLLEFFIKYLKNVSERTLDILNLLYDDFRHSAQFKKIAKIVKLCRGLSPFYLLNSILLKLIEHLHIQPHNTHIRTRARAWCVCVCVCVRVCVCVCVCVYVHINICFHFYLIFITYLSQLSLLLIRIWYIYSNTRWLYQKQQGSVRRQHTSRRGRVQSVASFRHEHKDHNMYFVHFEIYTVIVPSRAVTKSQKGTFSYYLCVDTEYII